MIACDLIAAFMALFWLKPLAEKTIQRVDSTVSAGTGAIPAGASARPNQES